ncbi:predicted protein [Scheffersomyces stipitis CBS 6054]|uniref:Uncharacterized protein n=1 Tax=Scheffersomyces stipitis (strain ATCC 58785 / CBS 6054 / NBRC 10063 / NRRL Y-11545) TaxID=322104 RepID=A3GI46_PICST|nr:predicted protein [Scheffersomyces stipitis CBS 6054]EAZ63171.2 predicted protein [Scheffersomyces stipitis CBS 6054]KAG2735467.1 hypothetical protein G9P44_001681 [Scheffersomyces stipitis]
MGNLTLHETIDFVNPNVSSFHYTFECRNKIDYRNGFFAINYHCGKYNTSVFNYSNDLTAIYYCGVSFGQGLLSSSNATNLTIFDCGDYKITFNNSSLEAFTDAYHCGYYWATKKDGFAKRTAKKSVETIVSLFQSPLITSLVGLALTILAALFGLPH